MTAYRSPLKLAPVSGAPQKPHLPRFVATLQALQVEAVSRSMVEVQQFAHAERDIFRRKIRLQQFKSFRVVLYPESGTNLSPRWLKRKHAAGADSRTYLATHHMVSRIKIFKSWDKKRRVGVVRVGFRSRDRARDLHGRIVPATLNLVAATLEYGSEKARVPARPAWGPHRDTMAKRARALRVSLARGIVRAVQP